MTFFSSQMLVWADIYTGSVNNLFNYSLDHRFIATPTRLPHERVRMEEDYSSSNSREEEDSKDDSDVSDEIDSDLC